MEPITFIALKEAECIKALPALFPRSYIEFENSIYRFARHMSEDYQGGFWDYYRCSNGAFFMAPVGRFQCDNALNYSSATLSGLSFGLFLCLLAYSDMSAGDFDSEAYTNNYHLLRDALFDCPQFDAERPEILRLLD